MVRTLRIAAVAALLLFSHTVKASDDICDAQAVQVLFDGSRSVEQIRLTEKEDTTIESIIKRGLTKAIEGLPGQTMLLATFEFSLSVWAGTGTFVESVPWHPLRNSDDVKAVTAQIATIKAEYEFSHPASALMRGATSFKESSAAAAADSRVLIIVSDADNGGWSLGDLSADTLNILFARERLYVVPILIGSGVRLKKLSEKEDVPLSTSLPMKVAVDFFTEVSTFGEAYFANSPDELSAIILDRIEYLSCIAG